MEQTYKIGEAAALLNLKTYVLRFWETEFPQIAPLRTEKGQRLYTQKDLELLRRIRFLLHEQGLTIDGARRALVGDSARQARTAHTGQTSPTELPGSAANTPHPKDIQEPLPLLQAHRASLADSPCPSGTEQPSTAPTPPDNAPLAAENTVTEPTPSNTPSPQLPQKSLSSLISDLEEVACILRGFTTPWKFLQ